MDIIKNDIKFIANTYKRQKAVFVKGKGSTLYDSEGKRYIDFGSGIAVCGLGQRNKKWLNATIKQASLLSHTSNLYYTKPCVSLAKILIERTGMEKVFFCNSGAEANECAIKIARKYFSDQNIHKYEIITLINSFHGRTLATLTATGQESMHKHFAPFLEGFKYVKAEDMADLENNLNDKTCAVMLELVQGEGGVNALSYDYVKKVTEFCKNNNLLLIIDEVQTGNGRTGMLYAYMQYKIQPDIITTAKGLGNGLPIGAAIFNARCANVLGNGDHGSTFGGNPVCCAAAIATINQIDEKLLESVNEKAKQIRDALKNCSKVEKISGLGLLIGIECDNAQEIVKKCLDKGLIVLTAKDKIRLLPALNISKKELSAGLKILTEVLK